MFLLRPPIPMARLRLKPVSLIPGSLEKELFSVSYDLRPALTAADSLGKACDLRA